MNAVRQPAREPGVARAQPSAGVGLRRSVPAGAPAGHELMRVLRQRGADPLDAVADTIARDAGTPLPGDLQARWGSRLGADLSGVRVHRDEGVVRTGGARGMSFGSHVLLAPGAFDPGSTRGRSLLGHEVAHTLQGPAGAGAFSGRVRLGPREPALESEADDVGGQLAEPGSQPIRVRSRSSAPALRGDKQITFSGLDITVSDVYVLEGPGATAPGFLAKFQNALIRYYTPAPFGYFKYRGYQVTFDLSARYRTIGDSLSDPGTTMFWVEPGSGRAGGTSITEITLYATDPELTIAHEVGHTLSDYYFGINQEGYTEDVLPRLGSMFGGPGGVATEKPEAAGDIMGLGNRVTNFLLAQILDKAIDNAPTLPPISAPAPAPAPAPATPGSGH